jgi:cytidyltransferase-like protein
MIKRKKAFASGCFDLLHGGHIKFLNTAAAFGDLYVALGSDANIKRLKEITPTYGEKEREYMLNNLRPVKKAFISPGFGKLHFVKDLDTIKPDFFVVNEDGHSQEKEDICKERGIKYVVLKRTPEKGLPIRSSTEVRTKLSKIPYRIDLAGGWLDQPHISKLHPGPVLTISVEPLKAFNLRSGMATSTRNSAIKLWGNTMPEGDPLHLAKVLFNLDNPPGQKDVAGSQDAIGMMMPGLNYLYYNGDYWPNKISTAKGEDLLSWLENRLYLIPLKEREPEYEVSENAQLTKENAKKLSEAASACFEAILQKDFNKAAKHFTESFNAQVGLFPSTFPRWIAPIVEKYKKMGAKGWKLSGAGGGGYLILLSEVPIKDAIKVKIRR